MNRPRILVLLAAILTIIVIAGIVYGQTRTTQSKQNKQSSDKPQPKPDEKSAKDAADSGTISVVAVGDVMLGTSYPDGLLPPNDGANELAEVAPILRTGDITFGNLEGPLLDGGSTSKCTDPTRPCFSFRVPTRYGKYLKDAGFKVMSLANNHALDFGFEGRRSSKATLDSLGIAHSGEIGDVARLDVKGKKIAVIAFSTYDTMANLNHLEAARAAVSKLAKEVDMVIVSFHAGGEGAGHQHVPYGDEMFLGEDRGDLRKFTHAMIDAGAILAIGHGPHVVRGMELYKDHLIAYSLGNFATYGPFNLNGPNGISLILEINLASDGTFAGGKVYPTKQVKPGGPHLDPSNAIIPVLQQLSTEDFGDNGIQVDSDGNLSAKVSTKAR
ncbi:MAG TPA: CapA family protein [Blastocatellia bacterium]|nr:CapA family protein [Blastocatellia bacterium]